MRLRIQLICLLFLLGAMPAGNAHAHELELGLVDPVFSQPAPLGPAWIGRALDSGADVIRLSASWRGAAPHRPADPTNPADPANRWSTLDDAVRQLVAGGARPIVLVSGAPTWAEGKRPPKSDTTGAWKPDPKAFGQFAEAVARRYSGSWPDPAVPGAALPRVGLFQAWNEPNLRTYLAPQWTRSGKHWIPASPVRYRAMLNAFYAGVKKIDKSNVVIAAGTAPFGEPLDGGWRMPPARFMRELFCLKGQRLALAKCPNPVHLDVIDHHPYSIGSPSRKAFNTDDVTLPDMAKLRRPLLRATATGRVLPRKRKLVWVTEVSWDGSPPDPDGVPEARRARWLQDALYLLYSEGVTSVTWYLARDQAPDPSYATTYQSGLYFRNGRPKLSERAFRFPFVLSKRSGGRWLAWGRAPEAGQVVVERKTGKRWVTVTRLNAKRHAVFSRTVRLRRGASVRARLGADTSIADRAS
jgi:hypothetical protein